MIEYAGRCATFAVKMHSVITLSCGTTAHRFADQRFRFQYVVAYKWGKRTLPLGGADARGNIRTCVDAFTRGEIRDDPPEKTYPHTS